MTTTSDHNAIQAGPQVVFTPGDPAQANLLSRIQDALKDFLGIPLGIVAILMILGMILYTLDKSTPAWLMPFKRWIGQHSFVTADASKTFFEVAVTGLFTQASIVISMMLLMLQQTASNMGNMIFDQFLRRYRNQAFAGYVVGALAMALILKTTVHEDFNPVLSASAVLLATILSIMLLLWFIYTTMEQMRPERIVATIYEETIKTRRQQREMFGRFRPSSRSNQPVQIILKAEHIGFLEHLDLGVIENCIRQCSTGVEVVFYARVGDYLSYGTHVLDIKGPSLEEAMQLAGQLGKSLRLTDERSIYQDTRYGLEQLHMIGWTDVSSARHNPEVGLLISGVLRDLLARWMDEDRRDEEKKDGWPVVYPADDALIQILDIWESLLVISSESIQHEAFAAIFCALAECYLDLAPDLQARADRLIRCALTLLEKHGYTRDIERALESLAHALQEGGHDTTAKEVKEASRKLAGRLGRLKA